MATDIETQHWIETYKSLITLSLEGFKFSALANGGAAVSILAYLGNVVGKNGRAPDMRWPMAAFLIGLTFCGFAILFAYLTQLQLLNEGMGRLKLKFSHAWTMWAAIVLLFSSLMSFGAGALLAVVRFAVNAA